MILNRKVSRIERRILRLFYFIRLFALFFPKREDIGACFMVFPIWGTATKRSMLKTFVFS